MLALRQLTQVGFAAVGQAAADGKAQVLDNAALAEAEAVTREHLCGDLDALDLLDGDDIGVQVARQARQRGKVGGAARLIQSHVAGQTRAGAGHTGVARFAGGGG